MSGCNCLDSCGCCAGVEKLTPESTVNRPGLNALGYRIGTHSTFFETMQARLSGFKWEPPFLNNDGQAVGGDPLAGLRARSLNDPSIAMLDAAAAMLDVLTFYQERIANEGYLRTATERRSVLELGRLVGYNLRPGVASSVYLAYTLDDKADPVEIAAGSRAQSVPAQNELPQPFETSDKLSARKEWNNLKPRLTRPQAITSANAKITDTIWFEGTETGLKPNDPLLFTFERAIERPLLRRVKAVEPFFEEKKTKVTMQVSLTLLEFVGQVRQIITPYLTSYSCCCLSDSDPLVRRGLAFFNNMIKVLDLEWPSDLWFFIDGIRLIIDVGNSDDPRIKQWFGGFVNDFLRLLHAVQFFDLLSGRLEEMMAGKLLAQDSHLPPGFAEMPMGVTELLRSGLGDFSRCAEILESLWNGTTETFKSLKTIEGFDALWLKIRESLSDANIREQLSGIFAGYQNIEEVAAILDAEDTVAKKALGEDLMGMYELLKEDFAETKESEESLAFQHSLAQINGPEQTLALFNGPIRAFAPVLKIFTTSRAYSLLRPKLSLKNSFGVDLKTIDALIAIAELMEEARVPRYISLVQPLSKSPSLQPANSASLGRRTADAFSAGKDTIPQVVGTFNPDIRDLTYQGWEGSNVDAPSPAKIFALRKSASLFGAAAPPRTRINTDGSVTTIGDPLVIGQDKTEKLVRNENERAVYLDASYDGIPKTTWAVIDMSGVRKNDLQNFEQYPPRGLVFAKALDVSPAASRAVYGVSGKSTLLQLDRKWINYKSNFEESEPEEFSLIRRTVVHTQSEELALAEEPVNCDICGDTIELDALYNGLQSGRWLIVSGERTDIPDTAGIRAAELVMLAGVTQSDEKGKKIHSVLKLAQELAYTYKGDTVIIYGNVVKATHGETRREVLGAGDASKAMQAFTLKQPPLTYVSAPNVEGITSTLRVRVNDVEWKETDTFAVARPQDHVFITRTDDEARTTVIFGNGERGARPPTGAENISAVYRNGIGKPGNVKAEQISLLMTKPLGVKEVINPIRASGGADKETRDQARRNVPIALLALDRLVSTVDYANFSRTFAGIGKASAKKMSDGHRHVVHLTLAGAGDIPIDENSDLYRNLRKALRDNGDPQQPVRLDRRELKALIVSANVRIAPEYLWEKVEANIRASLLDTFSFERRELGQSVFLSEVIAAIQRIRGVAYVDVDVLNSIAESDLSNVTKLNAKLAELKTAAAYPNPAFVMAELARESRDPESGAVTILPAQLAFLSPDVPDTLILNQIEEVKK